ncbi:hypothetical protein [Aeropyrum camini]|nr:hypothetical protein [Aeropyrum camini]
MTGLCIPEALLPVRNNGSEEPSTGFFLELMTTPLDSPLPLSSLRL